MCHKGKPQDNGKTPNEQTTNAFRTQAISQPNARQDKTGVALPDEENVKIAKDWVTTNQK